MLPPTALTYVAISTCRSKLPECTASTEIESSIEIEPESGIKPYMVFDGAKPAPENLCPNEVPGSPVTIAVNTMSTGHDPEYTGALTNSDTPETSACARVPAKSVTTVSPTDMRTASRSRNTYPSSPEDVALRCGE